MGGTADDPPGPGRYRFGDIVVDEAAHALLRAGEPQAVEPKAFAVLLALLRRPGELIARDDLLDQVWGHRHVTPGVLTRAIAQLRGVLGDDPHQPRYIQTRHALGYSFVGELLHEEAPGVADAPLSPANAGDADAMADASPDVLPPEPGDGGQQTDAGGRHPHRWRLRHWMAASLVAIVLLAFSVWHDGGKPALPAEPSIAVMSFANLSGDRDQDYFAEGLAVEMHHALAGVRGLKVAAQMSPSTAGARETDVRALGERLGVATVLDASVRREGERVRINARLSDTSTGYTLWSGNYDRELSDVFAMQSEIAGEVVRSLVGKIAGDRRVVERRLTPTKSVVAFDWYLRGLQQLRLGKQAGGVEPAVRSFRLALEEDGGMVAAQLGICRSQSWKFEAMRSAAALDGARTACAEAERLSPGNPAANLLIGDIHRLVGEWGPARERYAVAAADEALRAEIHVRNGMFHESRGHASLAIAEYRKARDARPGDASIAWRIGYQQFLQGRLDDAIASYLEAARLRPDDATLWAYIAGLYVNAGREADAVDAFRRSLAIKPSKDAYANYAIVEYHAGRHRAAEGLLRKALAEDGDDFMTWGALGDVLSVEGSTEEARQAYAKARSMALEYVSQAAADAKAVAALGWYEASLGNAGEARRQALRAEELRTEPGEVALINAQTFSRIGSDDDVERRLRQAEKAGIPMRRVASNPHVRKRPVQSTGRPADREPATRRN